MVGPPVGRGRVLTDATRLDDTRIKPVVNGDARKRTKGRRESDRDQRKREILESGGRYGDGGGGGGTDGLVVIIKGRRKRRRGGQ